MGKNMPGVEGSVSKGLEARTEGGEGGIEVGKGDGQGSVMNFLVCEGVWTSSCWL